VDEMDLSSERMVYAHLEKKFQVLIVLSDEPLNPGMNRRLSGWERENDI
jgi:hypothetical protein